MLAAGIYGLVKILAKGERAHAFKAIAQGVLTPLGISFGLFVAFTAAQVWADNQRANAAVDRRDVRIQFEHASPFFSCLADVGLVISAQPIFDTARQPIRTMLAITSSLPHLETAAARSDCFN